MESYQNEPKWYERSADSNDNVPFKYVGRCWLDDVIDLTKLRTSKRKGFDKWITDAKLRAFRKATMVAEEWLTKSMADYLYDDKIRSFAIEEGVEIRSDPGDLKVFKLSKGKEPSKIENVREGDEIKIRTNLKDLFLYIVYLILLLIVIFSNYKPSAYYLTSAVKKLFVDSYFQSYKGVQITFPEIDNVEDIFSYLTTHFKESLITQWYHMGAQNILSDTEDRNVILYENRMLGSARLKMMRVSGDSCKINKQFEDYQTYCFDYYTKMNQDDRTLAGKEKNASQNNLQSEFLRIFHNEHTFNERYTTPDKVEHIDPTTQTSYVVPISTKKPTTPNINLGTPNVLPTTPIINPSTSNVIPASPDVKLKAPITSTILGLNLSNTTKESLPLCYSKPAACVEKFEHKLENDTSISGKFGDYNSQGFIEDINSINIDRLDDLRSNHWIQRGTRALTIQFTVFNANLRLFCNVILAFELPPTGSVFPFYKFNTVKLVPYYDPWDYFVLGLEGGLGLYLIYFIVQSIREINLFGWIYFILPWHYLDLLINICLLSIVILKVMLEVKMKKIFEETDLTVENPDRKSFTSYDTVANLRVAHDNLFGIILFSSWSKIIRYFDFTKVVKKLNSLFFMCASEMAHFMGLVGFFFLAFAEMGTLMFGMGIPEYSTLENSYLTLLRILAGDTQFDELQQFDTILGPAYLIIFLIFVVNIVLNVSVSILNEAYLDMRQHGVRRESYLSASEYLKRTKYNIFGAGKRSVLFRKSTENSKLYDSDIVELLLRHAFNPVEIHGFMAKYKLKQYKVSHHLSRRRLAKLVQDIKYVEMNSYVPIDFFLNSAKQLKLLVEKGEKGIVKKMQEQNTKPEDYARIAKRLDNLDERYENVYTRMKNIHRFLKPKKRD